MNCRLPQTPRTPIAAAAHYFDDLHLRSRTMLRGVRTLRRSSTCRSLGHSQQPEVDMTALHVADGDDFTAEQTAQRVALRRMTCVGPFDAERLRAKEEDEARVQEYVTGRVRSMVDDESAGTSFVEDEIEATYY